MSSKVPARESIRPVRKRRMMLWRRRSLWGRLRLGWLRWFRRWSSVVVRTGWGSPVPISRGRRRASSRRVWVVRRYVQAPKFPPLGIVLCSLRRIAQDLVRGLDLLKFGYKFVLPAWIPIGVAFQRKLSKRLANLVLVCVGSNAQVCVVVASSIGLYHGGGERAKRVEDGRTDGRAREPAFGAVQADANVLHKVVSRYSLF
jgi:hypothetical protein